MEPDDAEQPTSPPARIELVDGDTITPLSADALAMAVFMCGFVVVKGPTGTIVDVRIDRDKVIAFAQVAQAQMDRGEPLTLKVSRVVRPNGNGLVQS